jgi:nicotinamidase-related amidase
VTSLVVTGVTTEVCVQTTVREANDRGFECLGLDYCVGSYFPEFHDVALLTISAQGGIFGLGGLVRRGARRALTPSGAPLTSLRPIR